MIGKADRHLAVADLNGGLPDAGDVLEVTWCLQQREVIGLVARHQPQLDWRFPAQIARYLAVSVDDVLVGHDVPAAADDKAGTGLGPGPGRSRRRAWCGLL